VIDGESYIAPLLNAEGRPASVRGARAALSLVALVSGLAFGVALLVIAGRKRK
jgi:hypothetical protein